MKIYVSGDLRSQPIRRYIDKVAALLEKKGHNCYVPHRDVSILGNTGPEKGLLGFGQHESFGELVLKEDLRLLEECEGAVFILDGLCWGTSVELGYALSLKNLMKRKIRIIGIFTDPRGIDFLDIVRRNACDIVVTSVDDLADLF